MLETLLRIILATPPYLCMYLQLPDYTSPPPVDISTGTIVDYNYFSFFFPVRNPYRLAA